MMMEALAKQLTDVGYTLRAFQAVIAEIKVTGAVGGDRLLEIVAAVNAAALLPPGWSLSVVSDQVDEALVANEAALAELPLHSRIVAEFGEAVGSEFLRCLYNGVRAHVCEGRSFGLAEFDEWSELVHQNLRSAVVEQRRKRIASVN